MFLNELLVSDLGHKLTHLNKNTATFKVAYNYWVDALFERAMRLFVWDGLPESIPAKEIEQRLLLNGSCGITNAHESKLYAFYGTFSSPKVYYDEFESYNVHSPKFTKKLEIGKEVAIIDNNALRNPILHMIHRYAIMLGHTEITLINVLIGLRDTKGVPIAKDNDQYNSIKAYRKNLINGDVGAVLDESFLGVEFKGIDAVSSASIKELYEVRENLLNSFYADLGVKTAWNKKGNMIQEEVEADNTMLLLNVSDMLDSRKRGAEAVNSLYGTNISVDLSPELRAQNGGNGANGADEEGERNDNIK